MNESLKPSFLLCFQSALFILVVILLFVVQASGSEPVGPNTSTARNGVKETKAFTPPTLNGKPIADGKGLANYAGGAVKFAYNVHWKAEEVYAGREIRLQFAPKKNASSLDNSQKLRHGFWIGYQYAEPTSSNNLKAELASRMQKRCFKNLPKNTQWIGQTPATIGNHPALWQMFEIVEQQKQTPQKHKQSNAANGNGFAPPPLKNQIVNSQASTVQRYRGVHLLVRTERGWFELHAISPVNDFQSLQAEITEMLVDIELSDPKLKQIAADSPWQKAGGAIGKWKALQSVLNLRPDGTVSMQFDREKIYPLSDSGKYDYRHTIAALDGTFEAKDDLLFITWSDGSLLNLRWRAEGGSLFLTDHHGRISQLNRLFSK